MAARVSLDTARVRENLERIRDRVGPGVEILAAIKYLEPRISPPSPRPA